MLNATFHLSVVARHRICPALIIMKTGCFEIDSQVLKYGMPKTPFFTMSLKHYLCINMVNVLKFHTPVSDKVAYANSADPDQTASEPF